MRIRQWFNKEKIVEAFKSLGNLRFKVPHASLLTISLLSVILSIAFAVRMLPIRWGMELSEFDPYFQFHFTRHIVEKGLIAGVTEPWHDSMRWFPYGFDATQGAFPGLPLTAAFLYDIVAALGVPISLYNFCILFPAFMGTLTCLVMYFLAKDVGGKTVGLLSALFLALSPSYITRTSLGFFDDETVGIFAMILFFYLFLRSIDGERPLNSALKYSVGSGLALGYFCASWGAAMYPLALTALFVFVLILIRRYSPRLLFSYSVTFGLGLLIAINVKKLSTGFLLKSSTLPVLGVFALLCLCEALRLTKSAKWKIAYTASFFTALIGGFVAVSSLGVLGGIGGKFIAVVNPFYRLTVPLIESVAEQHVTAWGSMYYDFGIGVLFFGVGLFFAARNPTNRKLFFILFGLTSLYFASSMVRLTLILTPALCVLWAFGLVKILRPFIGVVKEAPKTVKKTKYRIRHVGKEFGGVALALIFLLLTFTFAFPPSQHSIFTHAYSPVTIMAGSLPLGQPSQPITEWVEALNWISATEEVKVVCSWWDYGYWIRIRANKTCLADNGTTNMTQIQNVGAIFMSNETEAMKIIEKYNEAARERGLHNITHILVFVTFEEGGGDVGYGDEGKWMWMARIAGGSGRFDFKNETDFGGYVYNNQTYRYEWQWNPRGLNTTLYKLMTYAKYQGVPSVAASEPNYFKFVHPSDLSKVKSYGGIIPFVAIYEIDYDAYEAD